MSLYRLESLLCNANCSYTPSLITLSLTHTHTHMQHSRPDQTRQHHVTLEPQKVSSYNLLGSSRQAKNAHKDNLGDRIIFFLLILLTGISVYRVIKHNKVSKTNLVFHGELFTSLIWSLYPWLSLTVKTNYYTLTVHVSAGATTQSITLGSHAQLDLLTLIKKHGF